MRTRAQKRMRERERDALLWDLIVKNDDITFTHILPRLNRTDLKFLDRVNPETRALIKRSSRKGELKEKFKVSEMSSISTLEVAWEHYPWGTWGHEYSEYRNESYFCWRVAQTNKLELLKWAREEKNCDWDELTIEAAVRQGNLEMVKYCIANECPIDEMACEYAASEGHLEVLKYLREEVEAPWDLRTATFAAKYGHLHILDYLVERKYDQFDVSACVLAAKEGHLDCLKYLHETAKNLELLVRIPRTQAQPDRMFTIPPRQQLSSTRWLAIRTRRVTHFINTYKQTKLFLTETHIHRNVRIIKTLLLLPFLKFFALLQNYSFSSSSSSSSPSSSAKG